MKELKEINFEEINTQECINNPDKSLSRKISHVIGLTAAALASVFLSSCCQIPKSSLSSTKRNTSSPARPVSSEKKSKSTNVKKCTHKEYGSPSFEKKQNDRAKDIAFGLKQWNKLAEMKLPHLKQCLLKDPNNTVCKSEFADWRRRSQSILLGLKIEKRCLGKWADIFLAEETRFMMIHNKYFRVRPSFLNDTEGHF